MRTLGWIYLIGGFIMAMVEVDLLGSRLGGILIYCTAVIAGAILVSGSRK